MNCAELFKQDIFSMMISKLEERGYIIDELDEVSRVLISRISNCFDELIEMYNISPSIESDYIRSHAEECPERGWIYIAWDINKYDYNQAEEILKNYCSKTNGTYYNLFISSAFDKKHNGLLEKYKGTIVNFLRDIADDYPIRIGNIKTSHIREVLGKEGIVFNVHRQHPDSLKASNIKLINECKEAIFIIYKNSPHISEFLDIAKERGKKCYVLKIEEYDT